MGENFFKVGYTSYLENTKKDKWWTSIFSKISKYKLIVGVFVIIFMCSAINFWLIYRFINILSI